MSSGNRRSGRASRFCSSSSAACRSGCSRAPRSSRSPPAGSWRPRPSSPSWLNGAIGYGVERRSERTISGLGTAADQTAWVVRDEAAEDGLKSVMPGDLLTLRRGTLVARGCAHRLRARPEGQRGDADRGEPTGHKDRRDPAARGRPARRPYNMIHRGTVVTGGGGTAGPVATGARTEVGRIQRLLGPRRSFATPETPMQRQLDAMGRQLVWFSLGVCGAVFGIGVLRGFAALQMVRSAILLAVSAVPEGLPVIATTTLALGVEKCVGATCSSVGSTRSRRSPRCGWLLRQNRHPDAEPHVGRGCRLGPLRTEHAPRRPGRAAGCGRPGIRLARRRDVRPAAADRDPVQRDADRGGAGWPAGAERHGDRERARAAGARPGMDAAALRRECPRQAIRYRTEAYRFMVTTHRQAGTEEMLVAVKGSPEEVLGRCAWWLEGGQRRALTSVDRAMIEQATRQWPGRRCGSSPLPASRSVSSRPARRLRR